MARKSFDPRIVDGHGYEDPNGHQHRMKRWIGPPKDTAEACTPALTGARLEALNDLEPFADERGLLYRRHILGFSLHEMAAQDGVHPTTEMRRLNRLYRALADEINRRLGGRDDDNGGAGPLARLPNPRPAGPAWPALSAVAR